MVRIRNFLFFLGISFLLYAVSLKGMFVFDDYKVIVQNNFIRSLWPLTYLWQYDATRFLPNLTFALNFAAGNLNPLGYHIVNVALHGVNAWLVFLLVQQLDIFEHDQKKHLPTLAGLAAVLFLVHPVQTQSVSYIVQRSTLMAATVFLLAVFAFIKSHKAHSRHAHWLWYCLSLVAAIFGAFCKPSVIALPFTIIFVQFCVLKQEKFSWQSLLRVIPFFLVIVFVVWNLWVLKSGGVGFTAIAGITRQTTEISRLAYFSTQMNVIMHYIFLLLCPLWLNLDYDFPISQQLLSFPTWISCVVVVALLIFAWRWWKKNKAVSFGIFWFLLTLMPESSIFPLSDVIFEHRLYLPMLGFSIIAATLLLKIPSKKVFLGALIVLAAALAGLTVSRNLLWAHPEALLWDTIHKSPYRLRPIYNLETMYVRDGEFDRAEAMLDRAFEIAPDYPATHFKMGTLLSEQGRDLEAYSHFTKGATASQPLIAAVSAWRSGVILEKIGNLKTAEEFFLLSLEQDPRHERAYIDLGNLYNKQGRYQEAKEMYSKAIHVTPLNPNGYNGLATVLVMEGKVQDGIDVYKKAIDIIPEEPILEVNLAKTYLINKEYVKAGKRFAAMVEKYPNDTDLWYHLGLTHFYMGNQGVAVQVFERLVALLKDQGREQQAQQVIDNFLTPKTPEIVEVNKSQEKGEK